MWQTQPTNYVKQSTTFHGTTVGRVTYCNQTHSFHCMRWWSKSGDETNWYRDRLHPCAKNKLM